jgi:hypothetical protein
LGGEVISSKFAGQGLRKGARDNKGVVANNIKGQILRCDQLFLLFVFFLREAIIPGWEPTFYNNKTITVLVFT